MKRNLPGLMLCVLLLAMAPSDAPKEILLWPKGAPGSEGKTAPKKVVKSGSGELSVSSVNFPSITPYIPAADKATGVAIIVAPGGGHKLMAITHEGYNVAEWLQAHGIAAFVLKYRLAKEEGSTYTVDGSAVPDMQRAIRLVRSRAQEWGIDTAKIGVMGFSAGGELAGLTAMRYDYGLPNGTDDIDKLSSHPAFQALIYPGNSSRFEVTKNLPPAFIACGYNDRPDIAEYMPQLYLKYKAVKVPAELHIYSGAGHGFGMRPKNTGAIAKWPDELYAWLQDRKMIK
ncbi:alpha/beta hydrolase [Mucilaginibacter sp. HMF5004]|uniref:alpha/beta hydrolase n=1 Tax=Mucilaginibacter rivuli TaxID=2857527 RepID=UPI001C5EFCA9|nr:alpha/beta hydrolase [Mucilaginibacter rivuli]MBW4891210.1 alpha/beta hydrolase [Mucilaginibacter rivuli]